MDLKQESFSSELSQYSPWSTAEEMNIFSSGGKKPPNKQALMLLQVKLEDK